MNFEDRIKDKTLTKKEKIIADYILDNMDTIGFGLFKDVANAGGVSDTCIISFLRELG